jgi:hypothetical protein
MSTANARVKSALQLLGADTPIKPARAEVLNKTFTVLQQMLSLWNSQSLSTGIDYPDEIGDELAEPEQIQNAIDHQLAILAGPYLQKVPNQELRAQAKYLMQQLRNQFAPKPETLYPDTLPIGSGNKAYPIGPTFYPNLDNVLTDENGNPITT